MHVRELLHLGAIPQKEATFCLLDQRTFECHWGTVEALAHHKKKNKIELFYFVPVGWMTRSMVATKNSEAIEKIEKWWGHSDWRDLFGKSHTQQRDMFVARFEALGYLSVAPWPIYDKDDGGSVKYYMIHATDHKEAPPLMHRAYTQVVESQICQDQNMFPGDWRVRASPSLVAVSPQVKHLENPEKK